MKAVNKIARSRTPESRWYGSVRGALGNGRHYCDRALSNGALRGREINRLNCLPLFVGAALAILLLDVARSKVMDLTAAALGGQTTEVLAEVDGLRVACFDATDSELAVSQRFCGLGTRRILR